jgi:hypothetical protein
MRIVLFASATAATFLFRRAHSCCTHTLSGSVLPWQLFTTARLHPHQARLQPTEKPLHLPTLQLPRQHLPTLLVHPVHLKHLLCQIQTNPRNLHLGLLLPFDC